MAKVSRSGDTASRPDETGIAQRGMTPRIVRDSSAGSASAAPTMKCVIAEAIVILVYVPVPQEYRTARTSVCEKSGADEARLGEISQDELFKE